jgi:hypothetical protein
MDTVSDAGYGYTRDNTPGYAAKDDVTSCTI